MPIVFFLFDWLVRNSRFSRHSSCVQLNLLFDSCFTGYQHLLKLCGLCPGLSNSLYMFTVFIDCWIFSSLLLGLFLFLSRVFHQFLLFFCSAHFCPWLFIGEQLRRGSCNCSGMVCNLRFSNLNLLPCWGTSHCRLGLGLLCRQ